MSNMKYIEKAFTELFDTADCIQHLHDTEDGVVVSKAHISMLWDKLNEYRELRDKLKQVI